MEEEERRLPSPSAPGARRDSPPAPARALASRVAGGIAAGSRRCRSSFTGGSRANRRRCGHIVCVPPGRLRRLPARLGLSFPPGARGGGLAAPGHAGLPRAPPGPFSSPVRGGVCSSTASRGWRRGSAGGSAARPAPGSVPNPSHLGTHMAGQCGLLPVSLPSMGRSPRPPLVCHVLATGRARIFLQGPGPTMVWGSWWRWQGRSP